MRWTLAILFWCGCSYVGVRGPSETQPTRCTDSDVLPAIDSIVGVLGVAGALGGEIADHVSSHPIDHYELYVGLPVLIAGIVYLMSASSGTEKVESCAAAKQQRVRGCDGCPSEIP